MKTREIEGSTFLVCLQGERSDQKHSNQLLDDSTFSRDGATFLMTVSEGSRAANTTQNSILAYRARRIA